MKLNQKNLLLFWRGSAGAIALNFDEAITLSPLMPHVPFLCGSQISLLFVLAGFSFQLCRTLILLKTVNLTLKQVEYRTPEAMIGIVQPALLIAKTKEYKTWGESKVSNNQL